ncbi:protein-tyrosine phosphatase family protein [Herpetosiphon llansteffanensis]|uniref:protein-tyrosine phosphatase family protein n=1 Tax=Herpetosiphon llansteffanensis TaxID=2094568 RepID=UPI0013DF498C|nr:dual specificity protein phosphatase family protein [Herpetosiphon llansteffanensis]
MPTNPAESDNTPAVPIPAAYWVLPGRLLAGEHPMLQDKEPLHARLQRFSAANISVFIDLTEQHETHELGDYLAAFDQAQLHQQHTLVRYHSPIPDMHIPSIEQMQAILARINGALANQQTVYAHCWGGLGRTGTVIGCLLVQQGWEYAEALAHIAALRQGSRDERYP